MSYVDCVCFGQEVCGVIEDRPPSWLDTLLQSCRGVLLDLFPRLLKIMRCFRSYVVESGV